MIVASEPSLVISNILCQVLTGSTLLFFFAEPIDGWSTHRIQFFLILEEFYTDMKWKHILKKNYF